MEKANKKYELSAFLGGEGDYCYYRWFDVTNQKYIGNRTITFSAVSYFAGTANPSAFAVIQTTTDIQVELRIVENNISRIGSVKSYAYIKGR
jgi:hypothetical protein